MEKDTIKTSRASQSRAKTAKKTTWTPPSSLDAPPAPDGYKHRWLRTEIMGQNDTKNLAGHLRSGFELVRADEYPDSEFPTVGEGKIQGSDRSWWPSARKDTGRGRKSAKRIF